MARDDRNTVARGARRRFGAARPPRRETTMKNENTQEAMNQMNGTTDKAIDAMTLWADANQRVLNQLVELGTGAAKESVKLYAELQQTALDAFRESQAAALRWQSLWQEAPRDPAGSAHATPRTARDAPAPGRRTPGRTAGRARLRARSPGPRPERVRDPAFRASTFLPSGRGTRRGWRFRVLLSGASL